MPLLATLSGAERAHVCPGSTALAKVGNVGGASGSAQHEAIAILISKGREVMLAALADICARWGVDEREEGFIRAKMRQFAAPVPKCDDGDGSASALCEMGLCLLADRRVIEVEGGRGRYEVPEGSAIAGSIDAMWSEPEPLRFRTPEDPEGDPIVSPQGSTLWIVDWKTGDDSNISRADRNRQILWGAVLAAKWTGAERVMPALCFVEPDSMPEGRWDMRRQRGAWPGAPLRPRPYDREELATIEAELLADHCAWVEQTRRHAAGEPLDLVTGVHCEHCPAKGACPAWVAPVRALVTAPGSRLAKGPLTREEASTLATVLPTARKALDAADAALRGYVAEHGSVALPDGRVYGPQGQSWTEKTFETRGTYQVLADEIGAEEADAAFLCTMGSIEEAIRIAHEKRGIKRELGSTMRRVMAKLKEAGAITETPVVRMKAHHPIDRE